MEFGHYLSGSVALVVDLVNSFSPITGRDDLADVEGLVAFLDAHNFRAGSPPTGEDLAQVQRLRAQLRAVFETTDHEAAAELLNRLLTTTKANPQLTNHDGNPWHLHYTPLQAPLAQRLGADTAVTLAIVIAEHGFERLRVCEGERCATVFVDRSRNRSRRFCSPEVCGNRASVAAYRARRRAAGATAAG